MTLETFKQVEDTFSRHPKSPLVNIRPSKKWIDVIPARTVKDLPLRPDGAKLISVQKVMAMMKEWQWHLSDAEISDARFPYGVDTHYIDVNLTDDKGLGGGVVMCHINTFSEGSDDWHWHSSFPVGTIPASARAFLDLYEQGLIHPGRIVDIKTMHKGKFKSPRILFPYGNNMFGEELGHIEEIEEPMSTQHSNIIEHELIMDEL
jgi:hypothetical protein